MTATAATPPPPWERQPKDTDASWAAFVVYRDMGRERSITKTAAAMDRPGSKSLMEGWSSRGQWVRRASAFDTWRQQQLEADARAATASQRQNVLDQQRVTSNALLQKGLQALQRVNPEDIAVKDLPRWLDTAIRLQRQAVGLPDRIAGDQDTADDVEVGPVGHLSPEENRARLVLLQREAERRTKESA
jgi:hypothetical protein